MSYRMFLALFKLRASVDGLLLDVPYIQECKQVANGALEHWLANHDLKECGDDCPEHGHIWRALSTH